MFSTCRLAALAVVLPAALAHYNFESLIVNGQRTDPYQYVRKTTNSNSPVTDLSSKDMVCNKGGLDASIMAATSTHDVKAGDEVGFVVNSGLGHPGPLAVYMSRAPDGTSAAAYDGSGDWFKVYELTTSSVTSEGLQWAAFVGGGVHNFTFTLPEQLPPGNYLMRAEHLALHGARTAGGAQFYMGCAQLSVSSTGSGSPSPLVKFPGAYTGQEPGILINIYWPVPTNYTTPGPATWPNACEDHTANIDGQSSDGDCTGSETGSAGGSDSGSSSSGSSSAPTPTNPSSSAAKPSAAKPSATGASGKSSTCKKRRAARAARMLMS